MKKIALVLMSAAVLSIVAGCSSNKDQAPSSKNSTEASINQTLETSSSVETTISSDQATSENKSILAVEEAILIFEETYPDVSIISLELETSSITGQYYDIEGVDDTTEYELRIDSKTKEILKDQSELLDKDEQNGVKRKEDALDLVNLISIDEASKIAEEAVGFGVAKEWKLDRDLGTTYWEVKVEDKSGRDAEVKIEAQTGKVLEKDID